MQDRPAAKTEMKNLVTALSPHLMTAKRVTNRNDQVNHIGIFSYVVWTLSLAYFCETLNTVAGYLTTTLPKLTFAGDEAPYVSHVSWPRSPAASQACPWYTSHDKDSPPRSALDPLLSLRQCWPRHRGGSGHSSYWQDTDKRHPDVSSHHIAAPASQARNATRYQWSRCLSSVSIIPRL